MKVGESHNEVEQEDHGRQSIVQDTLRKCTDLLRRVIVPVLGQGGVALSCVCPHCHRYPHEEHIKWVSSGHRKKQCNWWCAARTAEKQKCYEHTWSQTESVTTCSTRSNSWRTSRKMVTALSKLVVQDRLEKSWLKIMDGLRRFIMADDHVAVKVGDLDKNMESKPVLKPKFTTDVREAVIREGADELTLRRQEEGMLRTFSDSTDVGDNRWRPPLGLASHLSGDCPRCRGIRMGSHVQELQGAA